MTRSFRLQLLAVLVFLLAVASPLSAQFNLVAQVNGQTAAVGNGGTVTFDAPAVGQTVTATLTVTYLGAGTAQFPGAVQILGSSAFSAGQTGSAVSLTTFQSTTVTVVYTAATSASASAALSWPYNQVTGTTTVATGVINIALLGVAPNPVLGQIPSGGGFTPVPPGGSFSFPNTVVNTTSSISAAIANSGTGPLTINSITLTGTGFAAPSLPLLPFTLAAGAQLSFTLQFSPTAAGSAQGSLQVSYASGSSSATLSGTGLTSLLGYQLSASGQTSSLNPGQAITLPATVTGAVSSVGIRLQNTNNTSVLVSSIAVTGGGYSLSGTPALPLTLAPNQTANFTVNFTPSQAGTYSGQLLVGSDIFPLSVTVALLPSFQFTGASGTQQPFQQPAIGLSLASAYPATIAGTLTIVDSASNAVNDPSVQFSTSGRTVAFTIPANTLQAIFPGGSTQIRLQTGTVAGTFIVVPDFTVGSPPVNVTPPNVPTLQLSVPPGSPVLLGATISGRTLTTITLSINGYDTTRSVNKLAFQLTPASGSTLSKTTVNLDVTANSQTFFSSALGLAGGGQFTVIIPFTLSQSGSSTTTDLTKNLSAISVTSANPTGSSNTLTVQIP